MYTTAAANSGVAPPYCEAPTDAGGNTVYGVNVPVSACARFADQAIAVMVTDVAEVHPMVNLSTVEGGTGGFVVSGQSAGDYSGLNVSAAGVVYGYGSDRGLLATVGPVRAP